MKLKQALIGLAVATIATSLFALPVYAGQWYEKTTKTTYPAIPTFWVRAIAGGCDEGDYLSDWYADMEHGATATIPPPPWAWCSYDYEYILSYSGGKLRKVTTKAWGNVTFHTGDPPDSFEAVAYVDAGDQPP